MTVDPSCCLQSSSAPLAPCPGCFPGSRSPCISYMWAWQSSVFVVSVLTTPKGLIPYVTPEVQLHLCKCLLDTPVGNVKVTSGSTRLSIVTLTNDIPLCLFSHPSLDTGTHSGRCSHPLTFLSCHPQILSELSVVDSNPPLLHLRCPASVRTLSISSL